MRGTDEFSARDVLYRRAAVQTIDPPTSPDGGGRPRGRVLVIDDEPLVGNALVRALSAEHDVVAVTDARLALDMLGRGDRFDFVLCDLAMPTMSGMELYARLRESHPEVAEQIVFMTGAVLDAGVRAFVRTMPNVLLAKPPDLENLRRVVRARVRGETTWRRA